MDKGKIVRLLLIPITIGLVVTLIVRQVFFSNPTPAQAIEMELTSVVVVATKEPIPPRTKLSEVQVTLRQVPKSILTNREFTAVQDLVGQVTTVQLEPGELILQTRVVAEGNGAMPYRIPLGHRAITIRIDELTGVAGHPEPGDLVDLILVLPAKAPDRPAASSRVLYEGVLVLGKGPALPGGKSAVGVEAAKLTSLTLAMVPSASVEVALGEQIGLIKVLLRPALKEDNLGNMVFTETRYLSTPTR